MAPARLYGYPVQGECQRIWPRLPQPHPQSMSRKWIVSVGCNEEVCLGMKRRKHTTSKGRSASIAPLYRVVGVDLGMTISSSPSSSISLITFSSASDARLSAEGFTGFMEWSELGGVPA